MVAETVRSSIQNSGYECLEQTIFQLLTVRDPASAASVPPHSHIKLGTANGSVAGVVEKEPVGSMLGPFCGSSFVAAVASNNVGPIRIQSFRPASCSSCLCAFFPGQSSRLDRP